MKKILGIIVLGLLLSGCSKKPEKIIENCADKKFDWFPNMIVLDKEFNKNKKFVKLNNSLKTVKSSKEMAAKNFKEYSFSNFDLSENDMKYLTNTIKFLTLHFTNVKKCLPVIALRRGNHFSINLLVR